MRGVAFIGHGGQVARHGLVGGAPYDNWSTAGSLAVGNSAGSAEGAIMDLEFGDEGVQFRLLVGERLVLQALAL